MRYDVTYISPSGIPGKHLFVKANTLKDVPNISKGMLSAGTVYKPEEFTIIEVVMSDLSKLIKD